MFNAIDKGAQIGSNAANKIVDIVNGNPEYILRIEPFSLEDLLDISLEMEKGVYRPLDKLSTGQKAVVIVQLSMSEVLQPIYF